MSTQFFSVGAVLDALVPPFEEDGRDWDAIVRDATGTPARPRLTRRRLLVIALAAGAAAVLLATPAFGLRGLISGLFGRTDVPFTGKTAPAEIKRDFYDLGLGAPPSLAPRAIASQARRVASVRVGSKTRVLWVAPTRGGGFCWELSGAFGGCRASRNPRSGILGVTYGLVGTIGQQAYAADIGGTILSDRANSLTVRFADGTSQAVPFYYVSRPIDAGFFYASLLSGHKTWATRPLATTLRDRHGHVIARQPFPYATAAQLARDRRLWRELRQHRGRAAQPTIPSPALPPPTAPLQRGTGSGVTAVAGSNGVVLFDTSQATGIVKKLISGRAVSFGCFRGLPYNPEPVELGSSRTPVAHVGIRILGMSPPFMGCTVDGTYGHRWPDPLHEHSAVEIPFTKAARRYFADRAAARDLALFLRSDTMHRIRRLSGSALAAALSAQYGGAIVRLSSPAAIPPAGRIGYAVTPEGAVYAERSTTGRRFFVRVVDGRIKMQNVKPLGFVF